MTGAKVGYEAREGRMERSFGYLVIIRDKEKFEK
jgi:hypothetical protein